jgi:hypothetical protein
MKKSRRINPERTMKKTLLILIIQITTFFVCAQDGFENGYIINYKGDTVKGKIKDRKYAYNASSWQKIQFINNATGEKEKLTPEELSGYAKGGTTFYKTLALGVEEKKRFVAVLNTGPVILYADISGAISPRADVKRLGLYINVLFRGSIQKIQGEFYLQKKGDVNSLMEWRDRDYKNTANYFFKDNKELVKSIQSDSLQYSDLQVIVNKYNEWKMMQ